jgi:hydroxymethylglutaryl-CoA lyase
METVIFEDQTLRDGLQNESLTLSTDEKATLFQGLVEAGVSRIQVGSFVHPHYVPQMADTEVLLARLGSPPGVEVSALVLNRKGLTRALAAEVDYLNMSVSASDAHSRRNVKKSAAEALAEMIVLIREAIAAGRHVRAGVQCAFGCVYQGAVAQDDVLRALEAMVAAGALELNLADTTGMGHPHQVSRLVDRVHREFPECRIALHLHDTRGLGIANAQAGYDAGARIFDATLGALGGCPFVQGATGNISLEDAVHLMKAGGVSTGIDLEKLCRINGALSKRLGRPLGGQICRVIGTGRGKR